MSATNGSLWTLPMDAEKHIALVWAPDERALGERAFSRYVGEALAPAAWPATPAQEVQGVRLTAISGGPTCLVGRGSYELAVRVRDVTMTRPFTFRAFLWRDGRTTHLLLASMLALTEFWQIPNDLTPTPEVFERFLREEVFPAVRAGEGLRECWK